MAGQTVPGISMAAAATHATEPTILFIIRVDINIHSHLIGGWAGPWFGHAMNVVCARIKHDMRIR